MNFGTLLRAEQNLVDEDYAEARQLASAVMAREPRNKRALMVFGWSEFKLGNYSSALAAFQSAEAVDRHDEYGPQAGIAWSHFKLGDLDAAEAQFLKARSKPRHYYEVWDIKDGLGWVNYAKGRLDLAEAYFRFEPHQLEAMPAIGEGGMGWQKDNLVGRGMVALSRNRLAQARDLFTQGIRRQEPGYFRHYDGLARTALLEGRYEEALDHALEATERVTYDEGLAFLLDAILNRIGSPERSVQIYTDLVDRSPDASGYHAFLGRTLLKMGRLREAEASFVRALALKPDDDWVKDDLARAWRRMNELVTDGWTRHFNGDYMGALAVFQAKRRRAREHGNPAAETGRGWAFLSLGRVSEAMPAFQAALRIDPNFASAMEGVEATAEPHRTLYAQAWAFAEAGKFDLAKRQFLRAKERAPDDFQWKIEDGLAWLIFYRKDIDKAEAEFRRVLKKFPGAYLSRKGLAYVALARGDYATAAQHLFASLSEEPKQVLTSYTFPADGFLAARRFGIARKLLEMGDKAYPKSADIQFLLAKAYKGLGDPRKASTMAVNAATQAPVYIHPAFEELALDPSLVRDAYLAMAKGLFFSGDHVGAIKRANDYWKAGGRDPRGLRIRGFALFRQGRYQEANGDLAYVAAREPVGVPPVSELISVPGDDQTWKIVYDARSTLAWSYLRLGSARLAADRFRAVLKTNPMWIDTLTGLGYSLLALGDKEGALASFRKALVVSPGYPYAWQGIDSVTGAR
ncbi:MAG: tetratricopeptide repeat protein [Rhodospirillales bacterium]